jgi:hypothetical protein
MLTRYSEWKRPTDAAYAFALKAVRPEVPVVGTHSDVRAIAREVLGADAERFEAQVARWSGPEDRRGDRQPYLSEQTGFLEAGARARLTRGDLETVLEGTVLVLRGPEQTDYVVRDHHMIDVALYHYRTSGELPRALFHADRHSDWCRDSYLAARRPQQAATWWKLFEGLKRPDGAPVLREEDVRFTTARAAGARDVDYGGLAPFAPTEEELRWERVLAHERLGDVDWASLDLDAFQPWSQLRLMRGLLRDARFTALLARARVRVFCLSPQFTNGGDKVPWTIQGSLASSLRLLNHFRR